MAGQRIQGEGQKWRVYLPACGGRPQLWWFGVRSRLVRLLLVVHSVWFGERVVPVLQFELSVLGLQLTLRRSLRSPSKIIHESGIQVEKRYSSLPLTAQLEITNTNIK